MLAKLSRNQLLFGALGLALLVTPYLACSSGTEAAPADVGELQAKLLGTWQGTAELDGETIPFSLTLEHAPTKDAPERLAVAGSLTSENPTFDGAVDGHVGFAKQRPTLSLRLDDGKILLGTLEGEALRDGHIDNVAHTGSFGLTRP